MGCYITTHRIYLPFTGNILFMLERPRCKNVLLFFVILKCVFIILNSISFDIMALIFIMGLLRSGEKQVHISKKIALHILKKFHEEKMVLQQCKWVSKFMSKISLALNLNLVLSFDYGRVNNLEKHYISCYAGRILILGLNHVVKS